MTRPPKVFSLREGGYNTGLAGSIQWGFDRPEMGKAVLVTGTHRSGSTWVGRVLASAGSARYISEPFNPNVLFNPYTNRDKPFEFWYECVHDGNAGRIEEYMDRAIGKRFDIWPPRVLLSRNALRYVTDRGLRRRRIVKDPIALLSVPWLAAKYELNVVVLVRHPAAFVASVMRQGWRFDFNNLVRQPAFMATLSAESRILVQQTASASKSLLEESAVLWKVLLGVIQTQQTRHHDWILVRHEDLSRNPLTEFESLFKALSIPFSPSAIRYIEQSSAADNAVAGSHALDTYRNSRSLVESWKQSLEASDVALIRAHTEPEASDFYGNEDW